MRVAPYIEFLIRPSGLFLAGALLLAVHPLLWLAASWTDSSYNSQGLWIGLAVLALAAWSLCSEQAPGSDTNLRHAWTLLAASATLRLIGQVLRVNTIGALTLALDVYALGTLAGLHQRRRAVAPFWLALLFAFSLPIERVLQRMLGYGLQQLAAGGACGMLGYVADNVQCLGQRIVLAGHEVLVDLPCAGAHSLTLVLALYLALTCVTRPRLPQALAGLLVAITGALAGNLLRIVVLVLGLAHAPQVPLMQEPWHELLGLAGLALAAAPLLVWAAMLPARAEAVAHATHQVRVSALPTPRRAMGAALAFLALCVVAVSLPAQPVDVAHDVGTPQLPAAIGAYAAQARELSVLEQEYFTRYGGGAARAVYGPNALLLVSTSAPLRHLHSPDECLAGSGHRVRYAGLRGGVLPTAIYQSTDPQGRSWRVQVSYYSSRGEHAASIAQAVWLWLRAPGSTWSMVERISPWNAPDDAWDAAVLRALDLPAPEPSTVFLTPV